jgi:hypothetical protein
MNLEIIKTIKLNTGKELYFTHTPNLIRCKFCKTFIMWAKDDKGKSVPVEWIPEKGYFSHLKRCKGKRR